MKLCAKIIDDKIIGIDEFVYGGEVAHFLAIEDYEQVPAGYMDISSIANWYKYSPLDYYATKTEIHNISHYKQWEELSQEEKDIVIETWNWESDLEVLIYLMTEKYMSFDEAREHMVTCWHKNHEKVCACFRERYEKTKKIIARHMSLQDAETLLMDVYVLVFNYTNNAIIGKNYYNNVPGIMDFVESTHEYYGNGLREKNIELLQGTIDSLIEKIKNMIVYGKE